VNPSPAQPVALARKSLSAGSGGRRVAIAALGDVMDPNCFGGAPWQFLQESVRQGFAACGWSIDVRGLRPRRLAWNVAQVLRGRRPGGFQFSAAGRTAALSQVPDELLGSEVISFHQHFPPFEPILRAGGEVNFYIDATYTQLFPSYGLDRTLDPRLLAEAIEYERGAFAAARRVVVNQSWAHDSLIADYGLDSAKCTVILPGANYPVFPGLRQAPAKGSAGRDRPFVMGFIGKDWRRKGLLFLCRVADALRARGWRVAVRAIGFPATDAPPGVEMEALGFIDKRTQFGSFLHSCDIGCLFSSAEAAGTAVLEFMGVGVPVAGFTVNGLADLLPASAGFRFSPDATTDEVAEAFHSYLGDEDRQARYCAAAGQLAPSLLWERCVREFRELWETGSVASPFRLAPTSEAGDAP
jgi:glycosyltransferase involved in cell wall biosynthesis